MPETAEDWDTFVASKQNESAEDWDGFVASQAKSPDNSIPPIDLSRIRPQPSNQPSMFSSGMGNLVPPIDNPDWAMTKAVAPDINAGIKKVGGGLDWAGKSLGDVAKAYAFEAIGEPILQAQQLGITVPGEETPDVKPWTQGKEMLAPPLRALSSGVEGLIESTPKLAAVAGAQAMGIPAWAAGGAVFGTTAEGFDPEQAIIGAVLPTVGKYSGAIAESIASKFGVSSKTALNLLEKTGEATGGAGLLTADAAAHIMQLPEDQRKGALIDAIGNSAGIFALTFMGGKGKRAESIPPIDSIRTAPPVVEAAPIKPSIKASAPEVMDGPKIAEAIGARYDGSMTTAAGEWKNFTLFDKAGKEGTTITMRPGSTLADVQAKYAAKIKEYADAGNPDAIRPPKSAEAAPKTLPADAAGRYETLRKLVDENKATPEQQAEFDATTKKNTTAQGNAEAISAVMADMKVKKITGAEAMAKISEIQKASAVPKIETPSTKPTEISSKLVIDPNKTASDPGLKFGGETEIGDGQKLLHFDRLDGKGTFAVMADATPAEIAAKSQETAAKFGPSATEPAKGTVRLYRGQDGAGAGGSFWSTDPNYARNFGANVQTVDVPKSVAEAARKEFQKTGSATPGAHILPDEWVKKSQPMQNPPEQVVHDLGGDTQDVNKESTVSSVALDPQTGNPLSATDAPLNKLKTPSPEGTRHQVAGEPGIGSEYTPEVIKKVKQAVREKVWDGSRAPTPKTTAEAWGLIEELTDPKTRQAKAQAIRDATGADMGPGLLINELWHHALKVAKSGDDSMLRHIVENYAEFEQFGTDGGSISTAGRVLRTGAELASNPLWGGLKKVFGARIQLAAKSIQRGLKGIENVFNLTSEQLVKELKKATDEALPDATQLELSLETQTKGAFKREQTAGEREASTILQRYAKIQSDTPSWEPKNLSTVKETFKMLLDGEITRDEFRASLKLVKVPEGVSEALVNVAKRDHADKKLIAFGRQKERNATMWQAEAKKMAEQGQNTAARLLDNLEKKNAGAEWLKPGNRNRVADIVKRAFDPKEPVLQNPAPWIKTLASELADAGVSDPITTRLAQEIAQSRETQWVNANLRAMGRASESKSIRSLIEDIQSQPLRMQDAAWRKQTAENWFMSNGLSRERATVAARQFSEKFDAALGEARAKVAEKVLGKDKVKNLPDLMRIIRAGDDWVGKLAEKEGWKKLTPEQTTRLAEIDEKLSSQETLPHERAVLTEQAYRTLKRSQGSPEIQKELAAYYANNALSGTGTGLLQVITPAFGLAVRSTASVGKLLVDVARTGKLDTNRLVVETKSLVEGLKGFGSEFKYAWKNDAYTLRQASAVEHVSNLHGLMERGSENWNNKDASPAVRAKGLMQMIGASTDIVRTTWSSLDQAWGSTIELQQKNLAAFESLKDAGLTSAESKRLVLDSALKTEDYYNQATARGLKPNDAMIEARDKVQRDLDTILADKLGHKKLAEIKGTAEREAELELGFHEGEGGISQRTMKWIEGFKSVNPILYRMVMGFPRVGFNMVHRSAWYSPYGWKRLGQDYWMREKGLSSQYEKSLGSEMQRRQRIAETTAGTVGFATLAAIWHSDKDEPDEKKKIWFDFNAPLNPQQRAKWFAEGHKPMTLGIRVPGTDKRVQINWNRGGLESLQVPIAVVALAENARANGKDMDFISQIPDFASLVFSPYGARRDYYSGRTVASTTASKAAPFIPFSGLLRTANKLAAARDTTSITGAALSSTPLIGAVTGHPALNFFGDEVSGGPENWSFRLGLPVNIKPTKEGDDLKAYSVIQKFGVTPTFPIRQQIEKKYGELSDQQWYDFRKDVGQQIKKSVVSRYGTIIKLKDKEIANTLLDAFSDVANLATAKKMGLKSKIQGEEPEIPDWAK